MVQNMSVHSIADQPSRSAPMKKLGIIKSQILAFVFLMVPFALAHGAAIKCTSLWSKTPDGQPIKTLSNEPLCFSAWLTGEIVEGDAKRVKAFLHMNRYLSLIHLISPGGDVLEAIKIAHMVRESLISTQTFSTDEKVGWKDACDSACVIVALGGVSRELSYLGLHRPTLQRGADSTFETAKSDYGKITRELESFFKEMGLPSSLLDRMLITGPEGVDRIYPSGEIRKVVPDFDAAFQQWLHPRCKNSEKYYVCILQERHKEIFRRAEQPEQDR